MAEIVWENVLLEWVNCLNLCESVEKLEDLKEGSFYESLLTIIKISTEGENTLKLIVDLLKQRYPNFLLETQDANSWGDISHKNLLSITSLLLHHTCITDRREEITLPLCCKLPQITQMCIKLFLENVDFDITSEKLDEIIEVCVKSIEEEISLSGSSSCRTVYEASLSGQSPLQPFLIGTPKTNRKSRFLEKERELKQLKRELELERYEKVDLQEELKLQQEKNDDLKKELSVKIQENKKLRGEILALQHKTPPHFNCAESVHMQRKLNEEIQSLETYIAKLEREQCDLEDNLRIKTNTLNKVEKECSTWQAKAVSLETTNDTLCEKLQQQQIELSNLQQHCSELSAMLDELKTPIETSDSSINWSNRRSFGNNEDLAHSVIDLQLKDVQKENDELRNSLKEYVTKIENLSLELMEMNSKCENNEKELFELQEINAELCKNLITSQENLKLSQNELQSVTDANKKICSDLQQQQALLTNDLKNTKDLNYKLQNELDLLRNNFGIAQANLKERECNLQLLREQNGNLCEELCEIKSRLNDSCLELTSVVKSYNELDEMVEKYFRSLEFTLFGKNDERIWSENKEDLFVHLLHHTEKQVRNNAEEQNVLKKTIIELQENINKLNEREKEVLIEKNRLDEALKTCQKSLETTQRELKKASDYNAAINNEKIDLLERIVKFENEQATMVNELKNNKNSNLKLQNDIKLLENAYEKIQANLKEREDDLQFLRKEKQNLCEELREIKYTLNETQSELKKAFDCNTKIKNEKADLEEHILTFQNEQTLLTNELKNSNDLNSKLQNELELLKKDFTQIQTNLQERECSLQYLREENKNLSEEFYKVESRLKESCLELTSAVNSYNELDAMVGKYFKSFELILFGKNYERVWCENKEDLFIQLLEDTEKQIKSYTEESNLLRKTITEQQEKLEESTETQKEISVEKRLLDEALKACQQSLQTNQSELKKAFDCIAKINSEKTDLEQRIVKTENEQVLLANNLKNSKDLNLKLQNELQLMRNDFELLREEKENLGEELCEVKVSLKNSCLELASAVKSYNELNAMVEEHFKSFELILFDKNDERVWSENKEDLFVLLLNNVKKQVESNTEERNLLRKTITDQQEKIEELIEKENKGSVEKHLLDEALKVCQQSLQTSQSELKSAFECNAKINTEKTNLEERIVKFENDQVLLVNDLKNSKEINSQLQNEIELLKNDFGMVQTQLKESEESLQLLREEKENICKELCEIKSRFKESCLESNSAVKRYNDLDAMIEKYFKSFELILFGRNNETICENKEDLFVQLLNNTEKQVRSNAEEQNALRKTIIQLQEHIEELNNREKGVLKEKNLLDESLRTCQRSLETNQNELKKVIDWNSQIKSENTDLQERITEFENQNILLSNELKDFKDLNFQLQSELTVLKSDSEIVRSNLEEKECQLFTTKCELEKTLNYYNKLNDLAEKHFKSIQPILFESNDESICMEDKEHLFALILENIKAKIEKHRLLNENVLKLEKQIAEFDKNEKNILIKKREIEQHLTHYQETLETCQKQLEAALNVNQATKQDNVNLRENIVKYEKEQIALQNDLKHYRDLNKQLQEEVTILKHSCEIIQTDCREKEAGLQLLTQENERICKELFILNEKYQETATELDVSLNNLKQLDVTIEKWCNRLTPLLFEETDKRKSFENREDLFEILLEEIEKQVVTNSKERSLAIEEILKKHKCDFSVACNRIKNYQRQIEKLLSESNSIEQILESTKLHFKQLPVISEANYKLLYERKEGLEIIIDDIQKQVNRLSKKIANIILKLVQGIEKTINSEFNIQLPEEVNLDDELETVQDLKSRTEDAMQQIVILNKDINYKLETKQTSALKENLNPQTIKIKDDELKRRNTILKQRLTLTENAKANLERKVKQLREENKKLSQNSSLGSVSKMDYEKILNINTKKYQNLLQQYEELASSCVNVSQELEGQNEIQYKQLQHKYYNLMSEKSQLELQHETTKKLLEDYAAQVSELSLIKEAYDKLVEENNQLMTECDTLNYKRSRDREEYAKALQEAKKDSENRENKKVKEIRGEYEAKLEKMKEKMIKLYKEEVDKEIVKLSSEKNENLYLMRNIELLRGHLQEANQKIHELEIERDRAIDKMKYLQKQGSRPESDLFSSRESLRSINSREGSNICAYLPRGERPNAGRSSVVSKISSNSVAPLNTLDFVSIKNESDFIDGNRLLRTTSVSSLPTDLSKNLKMEDEDDSFNNKYLSDLKEGACVLQPDKRCNSDRLSELAWRNSLCPPHLKSSYPAELQFVSPRCVKEDDIKTGNIELDDSMSTKLLPTDKPRNKKDIGTTSYKKPGPPTPSKNGGRLSLQGNEVKESVQGGGEVKTPKRMTPKRLKSLFMGRNATSKDNSENRPTTPRSKRLSNIFKKPR